MTKPLIQIDDEVREMNAAELANHKALKESELQHKAEIDARAEAKSALLEKLGITEDEAKLLLS